MTVDQILIALRRAAENDYSLSVSPYEAAALVVEVELLRENVATFSDDFQRVTSEVCAPDEVHCSCVPHLRAALAAAQAEAIEMRAWAEEAAKAENENAEDLEAARDTIQRLTDLVRYQRGPLHDTGLISDEEYAVLAGDHAAVARLEGYDALRADLTRLRVEAKKEGARSAERDAERAAVVAWLRDVADDPETFVEEATLLRSTSNAIERGEHRREESAP